MTATPTMTHSPVIPHLVCRDASAAIEFYVKAFGAVEEMRLPGPDGQLFHACVSILGHPVFLVDEMPDAGNTSPQTLGATPVFIHLTVEDADAAYAQAMEAGATSVMKPEDQFWGDRYAMVSDPFGHRWALAATGANPPRGEELEKVAADSMS